MILLQNPSIPTQVNAVEIDKAILDINSELSTRLSWITHAYGRAYKNLDITNGERLYFPEVYLGKQNGSFRYTNISPDNDKTGQCFFLVRRETITQYQQGMYNFLNYDVAIIFSVNMKLINETLTETDIYQQLLIAQVRDVLTRKILGKNYNIVLNNIEYLFEDVYREFNLSEQSTMEKSPLSHFRINMSLSIPEACPVPTILPVVTCKSLSFDGVNEALNCTNNAAFNFNGGNAFSFESWVKFDNLSGGGFIISKWTRPTATDVRAYTFGTNGTKLRFAFFSSNTTLISVESTTNLTTGVWYHLAAT
ncbi:LamG domain-containing protein, partial [Deltaproteobacteria bacterium]|nr:LamG domain-containing protein [Deltaproteobacteria bacterium]